MKTINATLLANQKIPMGRGYASAALADNNRLHPTSVSGGAGSYSGGSTIGLECATFYERAKFTAGAIVLQKISDPTVSSQWTTWNIPIVAAGVAANLLGMALLWTGTYVVLVWQELATGDLKYVRSSDGGNFSGPITYRTLAANSYLAGVSGTSPACGIMRTYQQQIYWESYNDSTDTWSAAESAGAIFSTILPEIAAFKDTVNSRYIVIIAAAGFAPWITNSIVAYTRATGSATWSSGVILFAANGSGGAYHGLACSQRRIGGFWWISFYQGRLWTAGPAISNYYISASNDGLFFDDPLPIGVQGNEFSMCILPAPSGGQWANAYWSTERAIYRLDTYTYWSGALVLAYQFTTGRGGHQEGGALGTAGSGQQAGGSAFVPSTSSQLIVLLDNRTGQLSSPRLFAQLTLTRGLIIGGTQYGQSAGTWYVTDFRYNLADGLLEITATDARGLLSSWFADTAYVQRGATIKFLVEWLCALAGVHTVTFDGFAAWTETIAAFTHPLGQNAVLGLHSLTQRVPFEYVPQENGSLYFYVPTAAPSSVYTYGGGAGEHLAWTTSPPGSPASNPPHIGAAPNWSLNAPPWFGAAEQVNYIQVIGTPPRSMVADAINTGQLWGRGRRRTLIVNDKRLTANANTTELANAALVAANERSHKGLFDSPPAFNIEPGDVINFSGSTFAATAGPWRVDSYTEHYNRTGARPYFQRVSLRGTA